MSVSAGPAVPDRAGRAVDTTLARALAMFLIANSHLEALYPRAWLAGDGLLGNSLFFVLSGFGLAASADARGVPGFAPWYGRRVLRIYPALWIFLAVTRLWSHPGHLLASVDRQTFLWPTGYGFIMMIMPIYALLYLLLRVGKTWALEATMAAAAVAYAALFVVERATWAGMQRLQLGGLPGSLYWALDLFLVVFGAWMARHLRQAGPGRVRHLALAAALFVAYVGAKLAMVRGHAAGAFPLLHWAMPLIVYASVRGLSSPAVVAPLRARRWIWWAATVCAEITLEVYIIHRHVADQPFVVGLGFPLDLVVFWAIVLPLSWGLARAAGAASRPATAWLARLSQPAAAPRPGA